MRRNVIAKIGNTECNLIPLDSTSQKFRDAENTCYMVHIKNYRTVFPLFSCTSNLYPILDIIYPKRAFISHLGEWSQSVVIFLRGAQFCYSKQAIPIPPVIGTYLNYQSDMSQNLCYTYRHQTCRLCAAFCRCLFSFFLWTVYCAFPFS